MSQVLQATRPIYTLKLSPHDMDVAHRLMCSPLIHKSDPDYAIYESANDYFASCAELAAFVGDSIARWQGAPQIEGMVTAPMSVLELNAGFGHLTRHLAKVLPNARIVSVNAIENGSYFAQGDLGIDSGHLAPEAEDVDVFFKFDVVICNALLDGVARKNWRQWFDKILNFAAPNALIIMGYASDRYRDRHEPRAIFDQEGFLVTSKSSLLQRQVSAVKSVVVMKALIANACNLLYADEGGWGGDLSTCIFRKPR